MSGAVLRTAGALLGAGLLALAFVLGGVNRTDLVLDSYLLLASGLAAILFVRLVAFAFPRPRDVIARALANPPRTPSRPPELDRLSDVVALATASAFDLHYSLRPILQEIAAARLEASSGIELAADPAAARAAMPAEVWEMVRPDRPRPNASTPRGLQLERIEAILGELERIRLE